MSTETPVQKLHTLIHDIDFSMLTTECPDGHLRSRPMSTQDFDEAGNLWFFTSVNTGKVDEVRLDSRVNVSYADPKRQRYVSVTGEASVVRDRARMEKYWKPILKAWFPKGLEDPELALLKVHVQSAEYWDSGSSTMVQVAGFVKAILTGKAAKGGENEKVLLDTAR